MKRALLVWSLVGLCATATVQADAIVGQTAPAFSATDSNGKKHTLADFKGKYVVMEWTNSECPFVKRQYGDGLMQALQKTYTAKGVVWLAINSSAPGQEGYIKPLQAAKIIKKQAAHPTALLLDSDGAVGKLFGAKTTPHMFVLDPTGKVIYAGAIDDTPTTQATAKVGKNYVQLALNEAMAGKAVTVATTQPYGCGVKY